MIKPARPIKIVIVDDEPHNVKELLHYLSQFTKDYEIVGIADNLKYGKQLLLTTQPDLVFLDIKLPDGGGLDLLKAIAPFHFHLIFFTAYADYAVQAFEQGSIDYLLKPLDLKSVSRAYKRFIKVFHSEVEWSSETKEPKIAIPHKQGTLYLQPDEVIYVQAYGEYCYFVTVDKRILLSRTLKDVEQVIGDERFIRIHRSYLVNVSKIRYFQQKGKAVVHLLNGEELVVSRRKKDLLNKVLSNRVLSI